MSFIKIFIQVLPLFELVSTMTLLEVEEAKIIEITSINNPKTIIYIIFISLLEDNQFPFEIIVVMYHLKPYHIVFNKLINFFEA